MENNRGMPWKVLRLLAGLSLLLLSAVAQASHQPITIFSQDDDDDIYASYYPGHNQAPGTLNTSFFSRAGYYYGPNALGVTLNLGRLEGFYRFSVTSIGALPRGLTNVGFTLSRQTGPNTYREVFSLTGLGSFMYYASANNYLGTVYAYAVPEPHQWAMMLVGLGLVLYQLRRRNTLMPKFNLA